MWFGNLAVTESMEYLTRIDQWRRAWRPERVRVLLIAESHVAERAGDLDVQVILPPNVGADPTLPRGFCRLVYCLGYGESDICGPVTHGNAGTWQFWDLFGTVASRLDSSITPLMPRRGDSVLAARRGWKLSVLETLSEGGVWLVDASIIGICGPDGTRRATGFHYRQLLRESFELFVWPDVAAHTPEQVWIIGRGVGRALAGLPMIDPEKVISQPQDRNALRYRAGVEGLADTIALHLTQDA